jgi:hypothetical protein
MLNCGARAGRQHRSTPMILPRRGVCFHFIAKLPNCPAPAPSVAFLRCGFFSSSHSGIPPVVNDNDTAGRQTLAASRDRLIKSSMTSVGKAATARDAINTARPVGRSRHTAPSQSTKRRLVLHVCAPDEHRSARAGVRIAAASSRGVPVPDSSRVQGNRNRCIA